LSSLQSFIYFILRSIAQFVLLTYFRKVYVKNRENFNLKGPTIVVSNHPNTLIDPVIIAAYLNKPIFFLANAGLFKNPLAAKILRYLYCIEIKRFEDTGVKSHDNSAAFDQSSKHLASGGNIYIAVEGTSYMERVLRPLKTGFARIGFQAITGHAKGQEIYILPIGINYEKHDKSGFDLEVIVGESIPFSRYLVDYHNNNQTTIKDLTAELQSVLESLVIHTTDLDEEALLLEIDSLFYGKTNRQETTVFDTHRTTLQHIRKWEHSRGISFLLWKKTFTGFTKLLSDFKLSLKIQSQIYNNTFPLKEKILLAFLGFPIYAYSLLNHFIAIWIPRWIKKKLNLYVGYNSTAKILAAIVLAPIAYTFQFFLISKYISLHLACINLLILPASFWFLFQYEKNIPDLVYYYRWKRNFNKKIKRHLESRFNEVVDIWYEEAEKIKTPLD
jgi:glycerol-3-phosphate O-acyltransferase/dihydroxyacetone phosphate acyltransferase